MRDAAEAAGVTNLLAHEFRWAPERAVVGRAIADGAIGEPRLCTLVQHVPLVADPEAKVPSWWFDAGAGGGWLGASGSHVVDQIRAWLGREGWKCDQTWNEWTYTLSPVAAAWWKGRPWHAGRFYTFPVWDPQGWKDAIALGWQVDGVCDTMRDHDDWALVVRDGLVRSILHARPAAGRAKD